MRDLAQYVGPFYFEEVGQTPEKTQLNVND